MAPDPVPPQELGARLFAAARRERPAVGVEQRTLAAMLDAVQAHRDRRWARWQVAAPLLLAAAGAALYLALRPPVLSSITREPIAASPSAAASSTASGDRELPAPLPSRRSPAAPNRAPRPSAAPPAPSLSAELTLLDRARGALERDEPAAALAELDAYQRAGGRRLLEEAELLRIEALARAGDDVEAGSRAREFLATHPGSPLVDRARSFLGASAPQPTN